MIDSKLFAMEDVWRQIIPINILEINHLILIDLSLQCWLFASKDVNESFHNIWIGTLVHKVYHQLVVWLAKFLKAICQKSLSTRKEPFTLGVIKICALIFVNFSAYDASILKISVPFIKRRSWRVQNNPNLLNSIDLKPSYGSLKKIKLSQKLESYWILGATLFFSCFLGQYSSESWFLGVFRNLQDLLLLMGTEIFKIDAEMAEKIEVEVGTFNTEINFLTVCHFPNEGCQLQLQFSQPFLHRFWKSLCPSTRGDPEDSETPPKINFLMTNGQENSKKQRGSQNWIRPQFLEIFHFL